MELLEDCIDRFVDAHNCVGLAVGIVAANGHLTTQTRGADALVERRPLDGRSVFRAGSITKLFTGIAVMQLVEAGAIGLDAPANSYLRRFELRVPAGAPAITVRHLLTHTSGLGELRRYSDLVHPMVGMATKPGQPIPSLGEYYTPALIARTAADRRWAYANHGFATLGAIIEDVSGEPFAARLRHTILDPLAMEHSDLERSERVATDLVDGHTRRFGRPRRADDLEIIPAPAGSLYTCVEDVARFVRMICGIGPQVLGADALDEMTTPQLRLHPGLPAMGLAFMIDDVSATRTLWHDGGLPGFVSHIRIAPDDGGGVIILSNSASQRIGVDIADFGKHLLEITHGTAAQRAVVIPRRRDLDSELCGLYRLEPGLNVNARDWMLLGGEAEVLARDDALWLRSFTGPIRTPRRLRRVDPDDPRLFAFDVGDATIRVAFSNDALHIGLPMNTTLRRRAGSFRRRVRVAAAGIVTATTVRAVLSSRRR